MVTSVQSGWNVSVTADWFFVVGAVVQFRYAFLSVEGFLIGVCTALGEPWPAFRFGSPRDSKLVCHCLSSHPYAAAACCGTTPLPSIFSSCVRDRPTPVTHPSGRPIIHSTNRDESLSSVTGAGAGRPLDCSHRAMAAA